MLIGAALFKKNEMIYNKYKCFFFVCVNKNLKNKIQIPTYIIFPNIKYKNKYFNFI